MVVPVGNAIDCGFTLTSNQRDFAWPLVAVRKDFGPTCRNQDNSNKTPRSIHRAPLGTHEYLPRLRKIGALVRINRVAH